MKRNCPFSRGIGWVSQAGELPNLHTPASHGAISKNPVRRTGKSPPSCRKTRKRSLLGLRLRVPDTGLQSTRVLVFTRIYKPGAQKSLSATAEVLASHLGSPVAG